MAIIEESPRQIYDPEPIQPVLHLVEKTDETPSPKQEEKMDLLLIGRKILDTKHTWVNGVPKKVTWVTRVHEDEGMYKKVDGWTGEESVIEQIVPLATTVFEVKENNINSQNGNH